MSLDNTSKPEPVFATTRWTLVMTARGDSETSRAALGELCEAYWTPVYRFLLREGRGEEDAREATQAFFARILEGGSLKQLERGRGRFRSYLLGALKHFLANQRRHEHRQKRGGEAEMESLDRPETGQDSGAALELPDDQAGVPDTYFDRQWALAVMDRALSEVETSFRNGGKGEQFNRLKPWLVGDIDGLSQAEVAESLGLTEGAVKVAIHRLRKTFRAAISAEISQTIEDPAEVGAELRYLIEVLSS